LLKEINKEKIMVSF